MLAIYRSLDLSLLSLIISFIFSLSISARHFVGQSFKTVRQLRIMLLQSITIKMKMHRFEQCQSTERRSKRLREALPAGMFWAQMRRISWDPSLCPPFGRQLEMFVPVSRCHIR